MCLLTDTDLRELIFSEQNWSDKDKLHIFPYAEECLTPVGYDLRVGPQYASSIDAELYSLKPDDKVVIKPGDTVLITTREDIGMPQNRTISAFITSKVSKVSKGLSHISTNIDPDWKGHLLIALHNPSRNTVSLKYEEAFCTINFIENKTPSFKDCGKESGRSDILLQQFLKDVKESRKRAVAKYHKTYTIVFFYKAVMIVVFALLGYHLLSVSPGFLPAMVALGVALSNFISFPKKD
jgi:deoxycytidine triphosphate deaminase